MLECEGLGSGDFGQDAGVEAKRDDADANQDQHTLAAAQPLAGTDRALHSRKDLAADQQGQRRAGRRAERIGGNATRRLSRWRRTGRHRSG